LVFSLKQIETTPFLHPIHRFLIIPFFVSSFKIISYDSLIWQFYRILQNCLTADYRIPTASTGQFKVSIQLSRLLSSEFRYPFKWVGYWVVSLGIHSY
jgi:hypothetical protein